MENRNGVMSPEEVKAVAEINEITQNLDKMGKAQVLGFASALNMVNATASEKPKASTA